MLKIDFAVQLLEKLIADTKDNKIHWDRPELSEFATYSYIVKSGGFGAPLPYYKSNINSNITLRLYKDRENDGNSITAEYLGAGEEEALADIEISKLNILIMRLYNIVASLHDDYIKSVDIESELRDYVFPKT